MNEQAIQDAYNLFVDNGYSKSIDEFKELMKTNSNALDDMYKLFVDQGYRKAKTDFSVLMGASEPVKKKDTTESPSEDGGSEQSATEPIKEFDPADLPDIMARSQQIVGVDVRTTGYESPLSKLGMYPDDEQRERAFAQMTADLEATKKANEEDAEALAILQKQEAEKKEQAQTFAITSATQQAARAKNLRKVARKNADGSESTVKFQSANIDGKNVVYPTLFPDAEEGEDYGSDPLWWKELNGLDAYDEALRRGEVFEFETEEEAQKFAEGSWKTTSTLDAEADKFYADRGMDYTEYKPKIDRFKEVRDELDFIQRAPLYQEELNEADQEKYARFYVNGRRRQDIGAIEESLNQENETLFEEVNTPEAMTVREDFDLYLDKEFQNKIGEAVEVNRNAFIVEDNVQAEALSAFGVRAEDLNTITPSNESEASYIRYLQDKYKDAAEVRKQAAGKYELASTWLDAKYDEEMRGELVEDIASFTNAWSSGWARGKAGNEILKMAFGITDLDDDAETAEVALKVIQYMEEANTGKQGRTQYRYHQARGFKEAFDVFANDPFELATTLAAESLTQMMPYGWKFIVGATATGTATGASTGLMGGPFAEVTVPVGALIGAGQGARLGFAATSMALEYTNAVMDAVRNHGYDPNDPQSLVEAYRDQAVWDEGRDIGLRRGIPIAIVDYLSSGLAGRVFKVGSVASTTSRIATQTAERVIFDPAAEAAGEYLAQISAGQDVDVKEIFAESIGAFGNNTTHMAMNTIKDVRARKNMEIVDNLGTASGIANETSSDTRVSAWANNMEKLGKITPEQNQRIQKNIGLRRDARDVLGTQGGIFRPTKKTEVEARLIELMNAREELGSTPNRREVFKNKIKLINEEIAELAEGKELRPEGEQVNLAGLGVITMGTKGAKPSISAGRALTTDDEETTAEVAPEETIEETVASEMEAAPEESVLEDTQVEMGTDEQTFLQEEVDDLNRLFDPEQGAQFQLELEETSPEEKQKLVTSAARLMEQVQPQLVEQSQVVEQPTMETVPINVTENTELANKVGKMRVADLVGKRINLVMADQLKVLGDLMGGPFFPLMEDTFGKIAWASIDLRSARQIVRGAMKSDFSVVYNMSPEAVDSNLAVIDAFVADVQKAENNEAIFNEMMAYLQTKKYGKKTDEVQNIAKESTTLEDFVERFSNLDVDTKAAIIKSMLPSDNIEAKTNIGKLLKERGITQEGIRSEISEQFAKDLPMGAMTMVLQITDADGNPITNEADIDKAIVMPEQQDAEGIRRHRNYPIYIRGRAVAMMEDTVPFWNVSKSAMSTINAKVAKVAKGEEGQTYSAAQARNAEMRRASMTASRTFVVQQPVETAYQQFVNRLSKAFPSVEVVTSQEEFNSLLSDLNAKQLLTKTQKVYGAVLDGKLYLNPALENYNTPIHEFGHVWMNTAKELAPEIYQKGIELIADTEYVAQVENNKDYQRVIKKMRAEGATDEDIRNYILEEALATAIGDKGESFAEAAQMRNFKNWLNELFEFIKKLTGISKMSAEQIQDLNLDEFLNSVVVDLLSENEVFKNAEVKSFGNQLQLMTSPSPSAQEIVRVGRERGFSDAAIREVLKGRGFKASDINNALEVRIDLLTAMPKEFERVVGGMQKALQLFTDVKEQLNRFATEGPRGGRGTTQTKTNAEIRAKAMELMRAHPVFKEQNDQIQMELLSAFDRTLGIRANPTVQREISSIRRALRQRRVGQNNLRAAQIRLKNLIRRSLPKSGVYSQAQINNLISLISKTNLDNFEAQSEKVLKIVEQQREKIKGLVIKDINKLITKKAKTAYTRSGKRRAGGLDAEGQSFFAALKPVFNALIANDVEALEKIRTEIESKEAEINEISMKIVRGEDITQKERQLHNLAMAYDTFGGINEASLEEVQQIFEMLKQERAESILRLKSRRLMRAELANEVAEETTEQIKETNPDLFDEEGNLLNRNELDAKRDAIRKLWRDRKYPEAIKEWLNNFKYSNAADVIASAKNMFRHLGTLTNLVDRVTNGKNAFTNNVYRKLNRMNEVALIGRFETNKRIDDIAKALGVDKGLKGIRRLLQGDVVELTLKRSDTGRTYKDVFSRDQLLRIYALSLNDVQRAKLENQGITDEVIETIKTELGPELIGFAEGVVEFLSNEYFEQVNSIYSSVNDVNLGYVENYFPTQTVQSKVDAKLLNDGDFNGIFNAETSPAFKERTDRTGDIVLKQGDFTSVLEDHLQTMEKYKAYAQGTKEINAFFNIPAVNTLLEELGLNGAMKKAVNFDINPNAGSKATMSNKLIDNIQRLYTGFALSFKAIQILKQATSFVNAYSEYSYFPPNTSVPRVVRSAVDPVMFMFDAAKVYSSMALDLVGKKGALSEAMEMSTSLRRRIEQGLEGDVYGLESGSKTFKSFDKSESKLARVRRMIQTAAASPTVIGDVLGVMGYMINYKRNIANGMNPQDAAEAFNNYNATQQSRRGTEKIPLQMNNNALVRSFTMFGSTVFLQINRTMSSATNVMRAIGDGKMPRKQDIRDLYLNAALANVLFVGVSNIAMFVKGDDDDRDEALKKMGEAMLGINLFYQMPFMGSALETADIGGRLVAGLLGEKYKKKRTFGDPIVNPITSIYFKTKKTIESDGWFIGTVRPLTELVIGTQVDPFIGLYNMFGQDQWNDDAMYDLLGISPSYRPKESDKKKTPPRKTMSKSDMKKYMPDLYNEVYKEQDSYLKEIRAEKNKILKEIRDEAYGDLK